MPTYEFRCPRGHEFEKFYRSIGTATGEVSCPVCGEVGARQLSAGGGLVFKGSGFYITDYGKDGKKDQTSTAPKTDAAPSESAAAKSDNAAGGEAAPKSAEGAKPTSASDAKPTSTTDSKPATESKPVAKPAPAPKKPKSE